MTERNKISKNSPKFMLEFFNKYREADKRWREMQQEAKIASTVLEKLQKEYAATPLTLFGKKQQLANAIKEVSAFTDAYFNGKLSGEGSAKWSADSIKDTLQTGVDVDKLKGTDTNTNTNATDTPAATTAPAEDTAEYVEYTYKPGDTFGQVIKNLGLDEGNLWGDNGSVKFYTDQLWAEHPEVFDQRGNIKIGQTIKLRKRGTGGNTTPAATATQSTQPAQVTPPANAIPNGAFQPVYDANRRTTTYVPVQPRVS